MTFNFSLLFILGLAALLRLINLNQSFWLDEAAQVLESVRPFSLQLAITSDFQPPLYHLLVHFLASVSHTEWWLRLASVIPGVITVYLTYKLTRLIKSEFAASLAALLLATSQFHLYYSQELRPYSLAAMFAVWSMSELFSIIKQPKSSFRLFTLINTAGLYTMYLYPFFLLSQIFIILKFFSQFKKKFLISYLITLISFIPWLPTFFHQLRAGTGLLLTLPGWGSVVSPAFYKMLPLTLIKLIYGRLWLDVNFEDVTVLIVLFVTIFWALRRTRLTPTTKSLYLWWLVPILLAFVLSLKIPVLDPKRVLLVLPAFYILFSFGLNQKLKSLLFFLVLLTINLLGVTRYYTDSMEQREPWRQLIASLSPLMEPAPYVFFAFPEPFAPWRWYAAPTLPVLAFVPKDLSDTEISLKLSVISHQSSIITFDYLQDLTDPTHRVYRYLKTKGYHEAIIREAPGIGFVRLFSPTPPFALKP